MTESGGMTAIERKALFGAVATQLITGSTYLFAKLALNEFGPMALGCLRFSITAAVFTLLLGWKKMLALPRPGDRGLFLALALLAVPLNQALFLTGQKYAPSSHGALMYALTPLMVLFLSGLFLGERITWPKLAGVALGFTGVATVLIERTADVSGKTLFGDALLFFAVVTWAVFTILSKKALTRYTPLEMTGTALTLGALLFLPVGGYALAVQDWTVVSSTGIGSVLYLSLLTSVVAYLVWAWALRLLEAGKVAVVSNLQPIIAVVLGWAFLGEPISTHFIAGTAFVISGVFLTQRG
ncbi:MAG: putative amino-acid metabolite efflux pump [bacterium ADurb.Bin374]|nr:MAG: putative amino-acid metabolite efflux pump [bacterium ADurb.Bin374]